MNNNNDHVPDGRAENTDFFAGIADKYAVDGAKRGLQSPVALPVPERHLALSDTPPSASRLETAPSIRTREDLDKALGVLRARMRPFLSDHSRPLPATRDEFPVVRFDWRVESPEDRANFRSVLEGAGSWERVSIPHYGPPLGVAVTLYRTVLEIAESFLCRERQFLNFDAVDYRCQVYLNDLCVGTHEGIFEAFAFDVTGVLRPGPNTLVVRVENEQTMLGTKVGCGEVDGDKIYAATGLGYNDPEEGWHHCPAGMGIWQGVRLESRPATAITDLHVRPLESLEAVEVHVEVHNPHDRYLTRPDFLVSVFGQNFQAEVVVDRLFQPEAANVAGFGDLDKEHAEADPLKLGPGVNRFRLEIEMPKARLWELDSPWLYQLQVRLLDPEGKLVDAASRHFGVRTFIQDSSSEPIGKFLLNGHEIRLRGANTMGHLDLCVFRGDTKQLHDDILLAKLTNLNFLRLTQHPVQREIYDACDQLGLMLQTDLPLFGGIRYNKVIECVRQSAAMEHHIRSHPSSILVSFINEPFPAGRGKPHRFVSREEMEVFFEMATHAVRLENPDRVIKCVDGDYDPPTREGMPDNHCYCGWYIGHGIDLGRLHRGDWLPVKQNWHFGCGEFGAEGLDSFEVMKRYYPEDWRPASPEGMWSPSAIALAQTPNFHYLWYDTPPTSADWIEASQRHQEWTTRLMTEAFRRMPGMNTFAIHLFIDAWPAGWMKAIMDVDRIPKRAWFAYRDALSPIAVQLRTDRFSGFGGETLHVELWVVNDTDQAPEGYHVAYEMIRDGLVTGEGQTPAKIVRCGPSPQGFMEIRLPDVADRDQVTIRAVLLDASSQPVHEREIAIEVFPRPHAKKRSTIHVIAGDEAALRLVGDLGLIAESKEMSGQGDMILVTRAGFLSDQFARIEEAVRKGATAVVLELPEGDHRIGGEAVSIRKAGMGPRHFVSRATRHRLVEGLRPDDFKFWFDEEQRCAAPILTTVIERAPGAPVLLTGDGGWQRDWVSVPAAVEFESGAGRWAICQVSLENRLRTNPAASLFAMRLLDLLSCGSTKAAQPLDICI
jgi:hypothetical protein